MHMTTTAITKVPGEVPLGSRGNLHYSFLANWLTSVPISLAKSKLALAYVDCIPEIVQSSGRSFCEPH